MQSTVQQRDMFRILLSQAETQLQEAKGTLPNPNPHTLYITFSPSPNDTHAIPFLTHLFPSFCVIQLVRAVVVEWPRLRPPPPPRPPRPDVHSPASPGTKDKPVPPYRREKQLE